MSEENTPFNGMLTKVKDAHAALESAKTAEKRALSAMAEAERENRQILEEFKKSRSDALQIPHRTHSLAVRELQRAQAALTVANADLQTFAATGKVPEVAAD